MSSYTQITKHPETGEMVSAHWIDDYFGSHRYGVRFPDGKVFRAEQIDAIDINGVSGESTGSSTTIYHWDGGKDES